MSTKQKDILYKAIELFNQFGYTSVGIDRIISESKVAKMTFYKYFPSKDILITECLRERDRLIRASISKALEASTDPYQQLKIIFDWFENWFYQDDFYGCMFIKALDELPHHTASLDVARAYKNWTTDTFNEILKDMKLVEHERLSIQICLLLDGAIIYEQLFRNHKAISSAWNVATTMIDQAQRA